MRTGLHNLTIHKARELINSRGISSRELTLAALSRIREVEGRVRSFVTVTGETAMEQALKADDAIARGEADRR